MFTVKKPTFDEIRAYLAAQTQRPFSYSEVGATQGDTPSGFDSDWFSVCLGHGREVFHRAKKAVNRWAMFPEEMAELCWPNAPIEKGTIVAALFRAGPFWTLNPCRIVYVFDEIGDGSRYGFAYGTLPDHLECGEERFSVEWRHADDSVWYHLSCFSQPQHRLAKLGYLYVRRQQRRFRELSGRSMLRAVAELTQRENRKTTCSPC